MKTSSGQRFVLFTAIVIASSAFVAAQSGRRGTPKSPVPAPPSIPETKSPEDKTDTAPRLQLLVGIQDPGAFDGVPAYAADSVVSVCVGRLNEPAGVSATVPSRNMTRNDAIKLAKGESQRFVVWLEVRSDSIDASSRGLSSWRELYVSYVIFEPATAKVKASGRAQHGIHSAGKVGIGLPPASGGVANSDYAIKESAREAADKILSAFEITAGPDQSGFRASVGIAELQRFRQLYSAILSFGAPR